MKDWARPVVHFEIRARDPQTIRTFYAGVFNWNIESDALMNFGAGIGGPEPGPAGHIAQNDRSGVVLYIQVRDLAETCAKAQELGGSVTFERFDIEGGPSLAGIADPEGNQITLVQQ